MDMPSMPVKNVQALSCLSTPYPSIGIITSGYNHITMNLDISHFGSMSTENVAWLDYAGFESPESNSSVSGARNDNAAFENGKASYSRIVRFYRVQVCSDTIL